ncbi:MAG TPA: adenylate/guanylate cyclase domain-containing protein [Bryobacteraceae bacterium]|nr:adenylate/guanylate cyclase domain-containing protein [Bryobacteraceae bacterium]
MSGAVDNPPPVVLKDESLSEARHNLRTPINHILGYGEMLMEDAEDQGREQDLTDLRRILDDGKLALAVINGALTPATNEVSEPQIRAMREALLDPVNRILGTMRRLEPGLHSPDAVKIRTAAEKLLAMSAGILDPGVEQNGHLAPPSAPLLPTPPTPAKAEPPAVAAPPLPLESRPAPTAASERWRHSTEAHLLVVDDNETNRDVLSRRLEREGFHVSSAENGRRALEMVRAASFDLVLLDIMMPEIDGYQVLSQMKADPLLHDIPVIMISALDEIQSVVRCIETGAEDYLNKPFDPVLLRARIGACLEKKRLRDEQKRKTAELEQAMEAAELQRRESDSLLRNILPSQIADELRGRGQVEPRYFEDVTILFSDFVGFTRATESLAAEDLVNLLHSYFTAFDRIVGRYGLEKLKTIGDSYMLAGGLPERNPSHPVDAVMAAFEMVRAVEELSTEEAPWKVRIGIHTGPVIAGVVGIKKFAFDVWGESVNFSSRMESSSQPNCINMSARTYSRVKDFFNCEARGQVATKEGKPYEMYFARGILPKLVDDRTQSPPPAFVRRYRIYFQKTPPAFPAFLL